jgi:hypothetical protein
MTTENWLSSDCPINGNLAEENRIHCDECNKLDCHLKMLSALDSLPKQDKPIIFNEENTVRGIFVVDIQPDFIMPDAWPNHCGKCNGKCKIQTDKNFTDFEVLE